MTFTTINKVQASSLMRRDTNTVLISLSDAEARVIENKAKKASLSINEYIRNTALGFPMG